MQLPDASVVSDFIHNADLAIAEINALKDAASALSDSLHDAALAFIPLAAKVRESVLYEFADLYGLTPDAVDAVIKEGAAKLKERKQDQKKVIASACAAKRAERQTQQQIADDLGVSRTEVTRVLVSSSLDNTNNDCRVKADEEAVAEVQQRLAAGETQAAISQATGISQPRISQIKNGKTGNESKANAAESVPSDPSAGVKVQSSTHHHSQPIHLMVEPGTGPNVEMEANYKRYVVNIRSCFKDIRAINKRLKSISNHLHNTFAKEHGGMIANWAAYEQIWGPDMRDDDLIGCSTFSEVRERLINQSQILKQTINTSLEVLQKIDSLPIIIED